MARCTVSVRVEVETVVAETLVVEDEGVRFAAGAACVGWVEASGAGVVARVHDAVAVVVHGEA